MKHYSRADRVGTLIHQVIADLLLKQIKDPRLESATITGVRVSPDLKAATVYFSVMGGKKDAVGIYEGFDSARGYIKRTLSRELDLKFLPELKFEFDESIEYGQRIDEIFKSLK
jgi:ribosome-binding factor A